MNSRTRSDSAQRTAPSSFSNHEFDFGLGPNFSKSGSGSGSLNAQKQQGPAQNSSYTGSGVTSWNQKPAASRTQNPAPSSASSTWTWSSSSATASSAAPSPASSWTWQSSSAPRSMVGDISGKSWSAFDSSSNKQATTKTSLVVGLNKGASPDLFGDLLGGGSGNLRAQNLKSSQPSTGPKPSAFSTIPTMASSLPRGVALKDAKLAKSSPSDDMGDFVSAASNSSRANSVSQDDGWGAFEGIGSKPSSNSPDSSKPQTKIRSNSVSETKDSDDPFRDFQGVPSSATRASTVAGGNGTPNSDPFAASSKVNVDFFKSSSSASDDFFNFATAASAKTAQASPNVAVPGSSSSDPFSFLNIGKTTASKPNATAKKATDPLESVLGKSSGSSMPSKSADPSLDNLWSSTKPQPSVPNQNMFDDWGTEPDFGGDDGTTTELEGLPAPPPGVSASLAKDKGNEYYKQGQFADAIKWLSWAEVLLEKSGESSLVIEVLTCRSSCLKEVGEYKKAVADCTKVIELENGNTAVILQRALLYESMEKYKLGIADLKEVLKKEPQNRVANNTLARLKKLGE